MSTNTSPLLLLGGSSSKTASFLAGAVAATATWGVILLAVSATSAPRKRRLRRRRSATIDQRSFRHEQNDEDGAHNTDNWHHRLDGNSQDESDDNIEIESRIGELPSNKLHKAIPWPWMDSVRRSSAHAAALIDKLSSFALLGEGDNAFSEGTEDDGVKGNSYMEASNGDEDGYSHDGPDAKGLCIGSIFGLDVGGTLAKLAYFEQQRSDDPHGHGDRALHYQRAAMARAVLEARRARSTSQSPHSHQSDMDLQRMWQLRQASVPDKLNDFGQETGLSEEGLLRDTSSRVAAPTIPGNVRRNIYSKSFSTLTPGMKRSRSMLEMSAEKAEALDRFYNFARRLDRVETGVKDSHLSYYSRYLRGEIHFIRFETRRMKNAMDLIRVNNLHMHIAEVGATGGGAHKYENEWKKILGVKMDKQDELDSLVAGLQFILADCIGECYTYMPKRAISPSVGSQSLHSSNHTTRDKNDLGKGHVNGPSKSESDDDSEDFGIGKVPEDDDASNKNSKVDEWWWSRKVQRDVVVDSETYPFLLVAIGTGVSILRVDGPRRHERISGSTIGGGTYWGLCRLLTNAETFEDVINLAEKGDPSKVDMMVGDIYGKGSDALEKLGLSANLVASSFGKLVAKQNPAEGLEQEDLARALLLMTTTNIGQVAYLNAQLHKTKRIYFVGNFLRENTISQQRLAFAINYWSKGENEALFLEHEGYFGALGAFLLSQNIPHPSVTSCKVGGERHPTPTHFRSHTSAGGLGTERRSARTRTFSG